MKLSETALNDDYYNHDVGYCWAQRETKALLKKTLAKALRTEAKSIVKREKDLYCAVEE